MDLIQKALSAYLNICC